MKYVLNIVVSKCIEEAVPIRQLVYSNERALTPSYSYFNVSLLVCKEKYDKKLLIPF